MKTKGMEELTLEEFTAHAMNTPLPLLKYMSGKIGLPVTRKRKDIAQLIYQWLNEEGDGSALIGFRRPVALRPKSPEEPELGRDWGSLFHVYLCFYFIFKCTRLPRFRRARGRRRQRQRGGRDDRHC